MKSGSRLLAMGLGLLVALSTMPAIAQNDTDLSDVHSRANYQFGQVMRFSLDAVSEAPIGEATLFYNTPRSLQTTVIKLSIPATQQPAFSHEISLQTNRLPPFSPVTFWWILVDEDGNEIEVAAEEIIYQDNRFVWRSLERDGVKVFTEGDVVLAQQTHDALDELLPQIQKIIPDPLPANLQIYLYPTVSDLQAALALNGYDWVGGHTDPELGVILLALPNSATAQIELRRAMPHELSHLQLYQATGVHYQDVPAWFNEGLATYFELDENPRRAAILEEAVANDKTLPFNELCLAFPAEGGGAALAYAQSGSLVSSIQAQFGDHALTEFVAAFADGLRCEAATQKVLGISMANLEALWLDDNRPHSLPALAARRYGWWFLLAGTGFAGMWLMMRPFRAAGKLGAEK